MLSRTAIFCTFGRAFSANSGPLSQKPSEQMFAIACILPRRLLGHRAASLVLQLSSNAYPPPDASRAGTADLCDVHHPESVDDIRAGRKVQIAQPLFRSVTCPA